MWSELFRAARTILCMLSLLLFILNNKGVRKPRDMTLASETGWQKKGVRKRLFGWLWLWTRPRGASLQLTGSQTWAPPVKSDSLPSGEKMKTGV